MTNTLQQIQAIAPHIAILTLPLAANYSLNDMWVNHTLEEFQSLFDKPTTQVAVADPSPTESLIQINESKLAYETTLGTFFILGNLSTDLATLVATVHFEEHRTKRKERAKIDLYDKSQVYKFAVDINEVEGLDVSTIETELTKLTNLLEAHRENLLELQYGTKKNVVKLLPPEKQKEAIAFLTQPNLIDKIDNLIEASGVVGEESNRKMIFVIASTYKMLNPLHGLVKGTSGSGKSHLINSIANLMPPEDLITNTRVSSKAFYYYGQDELVNKLFVIQDIDGLDEESLFAFRELQSNRSINNSVPQRDKYGNTYTINKKVNAKFASLVATTHAEVYLDNLSRSIVMGVDESETQTGLIIQQQNKSMAGLTDVKTMLQAKDLLQNCIRTLKVYEVVNPFADKLTLPVEAKNLRRLNTHYQEFVTQITLLNQYQRDKDEQGRLIATVEDLKTACEIMFDAIMWKIDDLDSSLRQFFERLKAYVKKQEPTGKHLFVVRDVRLSFSMSESQIGRFIKSLKTLEYIEAVEGTSNKGYKYKIVFWDDMDKARQKVKAGLMKQIEDIK